MLRLAGREEVEGACAKKPDSPLWQKAAVFCNSTAKATATGKHAAGQVLATGMTLLAAPPCHFSNCTVGCRGTGRHPRFL